MTDRQLLIDALALLCQLLPSHRSKAEGEEHMSNMIECGTCGYPLTPEERTNLIEYNGRMVKPWQGLTDDEIWNADEIMAANSECGASFETLRELVHAISDKLKEKNI